MTMPNMTSFEFADVVLVRFPFTDQSSSKQRPAVVVSSSAYHQERRDVVLMAVTSRVSKPLTVGEALVTDWLGAGLIKPSLLKPILMTAEKSIVRKRLGRLGEADRQAVVGCLNAILGPTSPSK